jgi:putative ABC transport system substrate-binding protein
MAGLTVILIVMAALVVLLMSQTATNGSPLRVGIVNAVSMRDPLVDAFQAQMTQLGYVEGDDIIYSYDGPRTDADERLAWAQSLVEDGVDILFGVTTPGAQSAAAVTDSIPVVFAPVTDPIGAGLVDNLNQPGGNVTGITNGNPHPLRMQFLFELAPDTEVIYAPHNPQSPPAVRSYESIQAVVDEHNATLIAPAVTTAQEIRQAVETIPDEADAIFIIPDPAIANYSAQLAQIAIEREIPFVSLSSNEVREGALLAYGEELDNVAEQVARMVDAIHRGASPAEMPVENVEFFLSLNLDTADKIGLDVPESFLARVHILVRDTGR